MAQPDVSYRLGNLTVMSAPANRGIGNAGFDAKRVVYAESEFAMTRKIGDDNSEWNAERIAVRQRWMAEQATAIWRIPQLS